jgi:uncharacterized protein (TIGR04222 family)
MNPFELPGPLFLLFFALMGCILMFGLIWVRRTWEPDPTMPVQLTDPYEIACLRGDASEVLRLATAGLIDRGLLQVDGSRVTVVNQEMAQVVSHPLERAILEHFRTGNDIASMFSQAVLRREAAAYGILLEQRGLISDKDARERHLLTFAGVVGVLWLTAVAKIGLAIERGHPYSFLVVLAILFTIVALRLSIVRKTSRGSHFLVDMQSLFNPLRQRSPMFMAGVNNNELMMMGAVFGVEALPFMTYPYVKKLFKPTRSSGSDGTVVSSCGSDGGSSDSGSHGGHSCGSSSSSGSSCGSSCGGGGGGCGGCGS